MSADTPAARIAAAIRDKPAKAYAKVFAADVVAVAQSVPEDRVTKWTLALAQGATRALSESTGEPDELEVFQVAGQLAQLLERAGADPV